MWEMLIPAATSLLGGMASSDAASESARLQSEAGKAASQAALTGTRETNQLTADIYKNQLRNYAPAQQGGQLALSALMSGLGLGGARAAQGAGTGYGGAAPGTFTNAQGQTVDANGNIVGGQYGLGNLNYGATQEQLNAAATPFEGTFNEQFKPSDIYTDPSYQWRLQQGQADLNARRAAGGNRWGSQAMKDITAYGQGAASQEYSAANERFLKNKSLLFDRLSGLAGLGSGATNAASSAGTSAANQIGSNTMSGINSSNNYLTGAAASTAAGRVGSTNAIVGGLNRGLNQYYTMDYLRGNPSNPMTGTPYTDQGLWDRANQYTEAP